MPTPTCIRVEVLFFSPGEDEERLWVAAGNRLLANNENPELVAAEILDKHGVRAELLRQVQWRYTDPNLITVTYAAVVEDAKALAHERKSGFLIELQKGIRFRSSGLASAATFNELDIADVAVSALLMLMSLKEKDRSLALVQSPLLEAFWEVAAQIQEAA